MNTHEETCRKIFAADAKRNEPAAPEHSPLPWHTKGRTVCCTEKGSIASCLVGRQEMDDGFSLTTEADAEANAALIVKCVNTHDALVEALAVFVACYDADAGLYQAVRQARAALAAAKG